ncbi:ATP-binding protein [Candidatus Parvarchaeota archaeon]|nr:ATP-binding protein [Candidatus Parvarchaeota archaeon]
MDIKGYLIDKKQDIDALDIRARDLKLEPTINFITSIIGPRRAGKTYLIYEFIKEKQLKPEEYLFINFEDEDTISFRREDLLKSPYLSKETYGKEPNYLFFDEVQNLKEWERLVYTLYEKKRYRIVITGSSSKLLSREIATSLRGRALTSTVFPLSFAEVLKAKNISLSLPLPSEKTSGIKYELSNYLINGGFPDIVFDNAKPVQFFRQYLDLVVFKDLTERFGIRNIYVVKLLMNSILSAFGKEFSISKQYKTFKSMGINISQKTVYSYAQLFEDSFFCFFVPRFSTSLRKSSLSIKKVYLNDNGFVNLSGDKERGRQMENAVFLELLRRKGDYDIFYWKDYQQREVDFVISANGKPTSLVQVTYVSHKDELEERECSSLLLASKELLCNNLLVITWDYEAEEKINGKKIKFIPLWKWLLNIN